jgi:hypothetical protein
MEIGFEIFEVRSAQSSRRVEAQTPKMMRAIQSKKTRGVGSLTSKFGAPENRGSQVLKSLEASKPRSPKAPKCRSPEVSKR